jgi:hypothetical protein
MSHGIKDIKNGDADAIVRREDGFYWVDAETGAEIGPFETVALALADMYSGSDDESDFVPGETLGEAEAEIGMSDWIDPETGEPAEDGIPRLED